MLLAFDTETTSAEPSRCGVVQMGAILVERGAVTQVFNRLCRPQSEAISAEAAAVHGITPEKVADAQPDAEVVREFSSWAAKVREAGGVLAGHNSESFDVPIIERVGGMKLPVPRIDTLIVARRLYPNSPSHKLGDLIQLLKLGSAEGAHDAEADVRMVSVLVGHFMTKTRMSLAGLASWSSTPTVLNIMPFGKHKGQPFGSVPRSYISFICRTFTGVSDDMRVSVRHHFGMDFKN